MDFPFRKLLMKNSRLEELITGCWYATVGVDIEPTEYDHIEETDSLRIASVVFTGGRNQGSLTIAMKEDVAKEIAGKMFDIPLDQLAFDDIRDSLAEVANVLAGNLKTDFFCDNELSKPLVMQGGNEVLAMFMVDVIYQRVFVTKKGNKLLIQVCQAH